MMILISKIMLFQFIYYVYPSLFTFFYILESCLLTTNQSSYITNSLQTIGKADLLEKLKNKTNFKKKDIEIVLTALTDIIKEDVLINGSEIRLRDFGTFKQKNTLPRKGRNPRTGETLQILGSSSVTFSASSSLKSKSNNDDNDSRSSKHDNINQ